MTSIIGGIKVNAEYLAHIAEDGRKQTVSEHLQNTADFCAHFAEAFKADELGRLIGLAHDVGKCSVEFQNRLNGGSIVDHATAGAFECAKLDAALRGIMVDWWMPGI